MPAYQPPHKRNNEEKNISKSSNTRNIFTSSTVRTNVSPPSPSPEPMPDFTEEAAFPTLGENAVEVKESDMNYMSSLFVPQPKEEIIKDIPDGWVRISPGNPPSVMYGDKSEEYADFEDWLEEMEYNRRERVLDKILERHEEYNAADFFLNGPKYMSGWELDNYIKELNAEKRREANHSTTDDSSSDDDYVNEFN